MKTNKGTNIIGLFMALLLLSSTCLPSVSAKENTDLCSSDKIDVVIEDRPDIQVIEITNTSNIVQVGDILISQTSNENFTEGIMEVKDLRTNKKEILKFKVKDLSNKFKVDVTRNDNESESYFTTYNPLNPDDTQKMLSQKETSKSIKNEEVPTVSTSSTSYIWDDVYFVKGSGVKYPHPSYSRYNGELWENYYINGDELKHHHIKQSTSNTISQLAPAAAGAAIGAYLGNVPGAVIGTVLGLMLGGSSIDALLDEEGCIWYWDAYTMDFITIVVYSSTSIFLPKYYRISSYTLWDTINVGNP